MIAGLHEWRSDLDYPESHSDMMGCVFAVLRMFEVKRRPVALTMKDIVLERAPCPVCGEPLGTEVASLQHPDVRGDFYAHAKCVRLERSR